MNRVVKIIVIFFVFIGASIMLFWGMQWFAASVGGMVIHHSNFLQSSLETSVDSVKANIQPPLAVSQSVPPLQKKAVEVATVEARSSISVEIGSEQPKVLFEKNKKKKLPIASLTKLMTAKVVLDNYDLSQKVTVDELAMSQEGEQGGLQLGQVFTAGGLLYIALMESSNRAAFALSEVMGSDQFVATMNDNAQKMGLENTHFQDPAGLNPSSYSSAEDLATLTQYLFEHYPLFKEITGLKEYDLYLPDGTFSHKLINTNQLLGQDNVVGGKTGFTNEAQGCFMVIQKAMPEGSYIINVVLGSQDRFGDMKKLMERVNPAY